MVMNSFMFISFQDILVLSVNSLASTCLFHNFHISSCIYHCSMLCISYTSTALDNSVLMMMMLTLITAPQSNSALLSSFHTGTHQRQTNRAWGDIWRGQSEIQCTLCWILFVSWSALAPGILHWPPWRAVGNLHCKYWFAKQVETFSFMLSLGRHFSMFTLSGRLHIPF